MDQVSVELLVRWRAGDEKAAGELFERYTQRLLAVARNRLSEKLARRLDPEDVVQSAYLSFFRGARDGRFVIERSGDLWRLLVGITVRKLHHQVQRHTAGKRTLDREEVPEQTADGFELPTVFAREPSPDEAAALMDEIEELMRPLEAVQRQMLELRLQGYTLEEIAAQTQRSERTVRRLLEQLCEYLKKREAQEASR
jgi:RNA polymerase sigma-70 factor (ECF subfamily)